MVRVVVLTLILGLSVPVTAAPAREPAAIDAMAPTVVRVNVPGGYDPNSMYVLVGQYGKGLALSPVRREASATQFTERIGVGYTSAKLLIYYPGCSVKVPALLDDPLYARLKVKPGFEVHIGSGPPRDWDRSKGDLVPASIAARDGYPDSVVIRLVQRGTISGRVEKAFLARNGVDAPVGRSAGSEYHVWFQALRGGSGSGKGVGSDGSFSMSLLPGTYDLSVVVGAGGKTRRIPVETGFILREGESHEIVLR